MKNIRAIIFDLGGVILNINYQNTIDNFKKLGIQNPKCFYSKKIQTDIFNQIEKGEISKEEFLLKLQKETIGASIKKIEHAWNSMLLNLPKRRVSFLKRIRKHYPIFLLSNTNAIHISKFKKNLGITRYNKFYNLFEKVYYSHEIGCRKPQAKIFKILLTENKLSAHEVLFIDDSIQHIKSAKKIGIKTHHLQHNEEITTLFPDIIR
ncbi:MAG: HAD family phosphatase [Bacteroidota bacterium]|nr:HAD family phosphatase [Bacteroidota bacterium]